MTLRTLSGYRPSMNLSYYFQQHIMETTSPIFRALNLTACHVGWPQRQVKPRIDKIKTNEVPFAQLPPRHTQRCAQTAFHIRTQWVSGDSSPWADTDAELEVTAYLTNWQIFWGCLHKSHLCFIEVCYNFQRSSPNKVLNALVRIKQRAIFCEEEQVDLKE